MNDQADREDHWATVLGCDMRAGIREIKGAWKRRTAELVRGGLSPSSFRAGQARLDRAYREAKAEKATETPA